MTSGPVEVHTRFTTVADGDFNIELADDQLTPRRSAVTPHPVTWLRQTHGDVVITVDEPGAGAGEQADGLATRVAGAALAIHTADCVPVLLWDSRRGVVGAAHAGWHGLEAEIIQRTVEAMADLGATAPAAVIGPCISPLHYEFGQADLTRLALRYGPDVVGATASGAPGLDLVAAARSALHEVGVDHVEVDGRCTASATDAGGQPLFWSWRARQDRGRQASIIWLDELPVTGGAS